MSASKFGLLRVTDPRRDIYVVVIGDGDAGKGAKSDVGSRRRLNPSFGGRIPHWFCDAYVKPHWPTDSAAPKIAAAVVPSVPVKDQGRRDWMAEAPEVSAYRRELAASIREQVDRGGDVYLGPTDALAASDALDGF